MSKAVRILSMNVLGKYPVHEAEDPITESRMKVLAHCVEHYAPDSVGVQEYGTQNMKFLPQYLPPCYRFVEFERQWIATFYNAEKFAVVDTRCQKLTTSSNQGYRFTLAVFAHRESGALAYIHGNLHLEYKDKQTRLINGQEVNAVLTELFCKNEEYKALPLVITGDYNAKTVEEPEVFSAIGGSLDIRDAIEVALIAEEGQTTFHPVGVPAGKGNAIDHALVHCTTTLVHRYNVIKEDDFPDILSASDHYPILVELSSRGESAEA